MADVSVTMRRSTPVGVMEIKIEGIRNEIDAEIAATTAAKRERMDLERTTTDMETGNKTLYFVGRGKRRLTVEIRRQLGGGV